MRNDCYRCEKTDIVSVGRAKWTTLVKVVHLMRSTLTLIQYSYPVLETLRRGPLAMRREMEDKEQSVTFITTLRSDLH